MNSEYKPSLRLCHLHRWPNFMGYGFHLEAIKGKHGQFIGMVDKESPAFYGGLKQYDKVIEVNDHNITLENHHDVVERVKSNPKSVSLLVVSQSDEKWFTEQQIVISRNLPNIQEIFCPTENPNKPDKVKIPADNAPSPNTSHSSHAVGVAAAAGATKSTVVNGSTNVPAAPVSPSPSSSISTTGGGSGSESMSRKLPAAMDGSGGGGSSSTASSEHASQSPTRSSVKTPPLESLQLSAKEMRAQLMSKSSKRRDIKTEPQKTFRDKASLFHEL